MKKENTAAQSQAWLLVKDTNMTRYLRPVLEKDNDRARIVP